MNNNNPSFIFLFNTLLGSGLFLLPGLAAGAGSGGYLIPIMALPVLLYGFLTAYNIAFIPFDKKLKTVLKWLYCALCAAVASVAVALCALLCRDIILPDASPTALIAALVLVIYFAIASKNSINGLNTVFFICFALVIISMLFSITEFKSDRLSFKLYSPISSLAAILPFFSGLITVPFLAKNKARKQSMCGALVLSCIVYALLTALLIGTLGQSLAAKEKYSMYITLKSGQTLLDVRLLIASIAFSVVLIKPAANLAYVAVNTVTYKKWLRPAVLILVFTLSLMLEKIIG